MKKTLIYFFVLISLFFALIPTTTVSSFGIETSYEGSQPLSDVPESDSALD